MRMPYQATPKLPPMPMRLKRMMMAICRKVDPVSQKYATMTVADEQLEHEQQLALLDHVGLAGLVDQLRDLAHGRMHRQLLDRQVALQAEDQAQHADQQPAEEELVAVQPEEAPLLQARQAEIHLAAGGVRAVGRPRRHLLRRRSGRRALRVLLRLRGQRSKQADQAGPRPAQGRGARVRVFRASFGSSLQGLRGDRNSIAPVAYSSIRPFYVTRRADGSAGIHSRFPRRQVGRKQGRGRRSIRARGHHRPQGHDARRPRGWPLHTRILVGLAVGVRRRPDRQRDHRRQPPRASPGWSTTSPSRSARCSCAALLMIVVAAGRLVADPRRGRHRRRETPRPRGPEVVRLLPRGLGDLRRHRPGPRQHHPPRRARLAPRRRRCSSSATRPTPASASRRSARRSASTESPLMQVVKTIVPANPRWPSPGRRRQPRLRRRVPEHAAADVLRADPRRSPDARVAGRRSRAAAARAGERLRAVRARSSTS